MYWSLDRGEPVFHGIITECLDYRSRGERPEVILNEIEIPAPDPHDCHGEYENFRGNKSNGFFIIGF
jgi:hypothetical protein